MGGCRCSYRSCKARSDGKTHMFHFPVFDKVRCHRWITNAHKPEYLNLKVSQLRNRVICQHHFKDDNFMNFMRDKLKNTAVPTENGPFCEFSEPIISMADYDKPVIPINADDIENDNTLYYLEKKAHSEVKYGDFLINDITELFISGQHGIEDYKNKDSDKVTSKLNQLDQSRMIEDYNKYTLNYKNDELSNPLFGKGTPKPTVVAIEYDDLPSKVPQMESSNNADIKSQESMNTSTTVEYQNHKLKPINPDKAVKILSEKTISEPVIVGGKLEPISPSMIIKRPKKKIEKCEERDCDIKPKSENILPHLDLQAMNDNNVLHTTHVNFYEQNIPIEYRPQDFQVNNNIDGGISLNQLENLNLEKQSANLQFIDPNNTEVQFRLENVDKQNSTLFEHISQCLQQNEGKEIIEPRNVEKQLVEPTKISLAQKPNATSSPISKSILKTRMPPEKLAAIEDKRKFNMKLRDVITSCLNNLKEQNEIKAEKNISPDKRSKAKTKELVPIEPRSTKSQDSVTTYLESRLQQMENVLLNKIDHNTQRIKELKRAVKPHSGVKNASTQTYNHLNHHAQKQQLYREISKYLSSDAKSIIFEELFMNVSKNTFKNDSDSSSSPRKKRRKRR